MCRFEETSLPPKEAFYNHLKEAPVKDSDYEHAQKVFAEFEMDCLAQYHHLYLLTDITFLADTFTAFRKMCLNYYSIDPAHCYTTPGLSWQAALRMTGVKLELIEDVDIHQFFEHGIRGM